MLARHLDLDAASDLDLASELPDRRAERSGDLRCAGRHQQRSVRWSPRREADSWREKKPRCIGQLPDDVFVVLPSMSLAALGYCLQASHTQVPGKGGITWFLRIYGGGRRGFT